MNIPESLIAVLRCPESHQPLAQAKANTLLELNQRISSSQISNRGGELIKTEIEAGLVREDGKRLYPIIDGFPVMLADEAIDLE